MLINTLDTIKLKSSAHSRTFSKKKKGKEVHRLRKYLQYRYLRKNSYPGHTKKNPTKGQMTQWTTWAHNSNRHFTKEDKQWPITTRIRCSPSSGSREIQIKSTMMHHSTTRVAVKANRTKCWRECETTGTLYKILMRIENRTITLKNSFL